MWWKNKKVIASLALMLCSIPAFANHGVDAMGDGLEILFFIALGVAIITGIAFIIAARNVKRKKLSLRIASFMLSLPLAGLTVLSFYFSPIIGFIFGGILLLLWMQIYRSYDAYNESGDVQ